MEKHVCTELCIPELQVRIVKTDPPIVGKVRRVDTPLTLEKGSRPAQPRQEVPAWLRDLSN